MNQSFKFRSDEFDENAEDSGVNKDDGSKYSTDGQVRNIGFNLSAGGKKFLNYSYLVSGEISPTNGAITLQFTTDKVVLQGIRLNSLYDDLFFHRPMEIKLQNERYEALENPDKPIVTSIKIEE